LTQNGIYYDTLKVVSRHGCQSVKISSRAFEVKVPQANFSPNFFIRSSDTQGCVPLTVNFKDETLYVTPNDYIENRNWNFGDNATSTIQNPVHTFATLNTFIVSLIIKTHRGCVSEYQYTVKTGTPQIASFTVSQPQNICASEQEQFINTSQDTNLINSYFWKFGDNTISVKKNPTHQFSDTGFMSVQLYVYNNGCVSFFKRDSVFYIKGPLAAPTYVLNCYSNFTPVFSAQVKGFDSFSWDFGDGSSLETLNLNPSHSYSQRGMYNVKFHASNSVTSCQTDVQKPIRITDITASYSRTDSVGCENLNVVFDGSTSVDNESIANGNVAGKYLWDFDDGSPKIVSNIAVTHKYKYNGIFHPRLTVEDIQGCFDTISHRIKISKPFVNFGTDSMNGCMPMTVYFKSLTQPDTTTSTWQWDFGDGQISSEENPIHVYNQFGQYSVQLKVVDVLTCESQITKNNFIKAQKPFPDFYATDRTLCAGDTIQFFSLSDDSISEYFWDFGNGKTSNSVAPFAVYPDSGSFNISLKLIDNVGCDSMQVLQKFIAVQKPPIPDFDADTLSSVCFPLTVQFNDLSAHSQLKNWLWNFGFGGAISVFKNPIFTYPRPGNYTVSLTVSSSFGCKAEISKSNYIQVGGPYAEFNLPDTACAWSAILFNEQNEQNVHTRKWYFGDGACFEGDSVFHGFDNSGFVYPTLFLTADENHTCDKYFQDTIFIQKPGAQMKSDVGFDGCIPLEIQLFDQTQTDVCRNWDFGNGFSSTEANPQTVYIKPGTFQVKLLVTDSKSCKDTSIQIINVFPLPTLKINNDTLICRGQSTDLSIFGAKTYSWYPKLYLDDYNSSNPTSNPDSTITYQVTAIDSDLCVNNAKTTVKVQQHPVANLKDTTVIIGETIRFNVYSKDIGNYSWSPESVVDCSNCSQISFKAIDPILISLAYSDTARCFTENTSSYISIRREYTVDVPNAFSPNGDGVNDVLYVRGWGIKDLSEFKIYNRFGEMVFSSQDINVGWDGTYKGKLQNIETYIYTVTVRNYDDQILTKKGTFKLLK
jgi:gliding motility-associated-like protein